VAVRIGFDDNRTLGEKETGGRTALPIFREIMLRVYQGKLVGPAPLFPREIEVGRRLPGNAGLAQSWA
jgi:membrane carboxypeptidase/penicillin-binding protein